MKLNELSAALKKRLSSPLPGDTAHAPMRAVPVGKMIPRFEHKLPPRPGGVLILLYEEHGIIKFPLIKRQEYVGAHSGQISLPGGKSEAGENSIQAALREAEEEIGVNRNLPAVLGTLSNFFVIPSNFIITPVIAVVDTVPEFQKNEYEVARIITSAVEYIASDDAIKEREILAAGKFNMVAPHFEIEGEIVWGATAMMLNEFRLLLREILKK